MSISRYPTLYSKTSTGAIQTWTIARNGNSYTVTTGQVDGKKTTSKPTVCEGKNIGRINETSPEDQAQLEVQAKVKKKLKTGYFQNIEDVDKMSYISPILAKKFKDRRDKVKYPQILQEKKNGGRCIITKGGAFSRKGEEWLTIPHITDSLKPFFEKWPDAVLDGELFNYDLRENLNDMMSIIRRTKNITPEHLEKSKEIVEFHCYDGYGHCNTTKDHPYSFRKSSIDLICDEYEYLKVVEDHYVNSEEEAMQVYQSFLDDNHEGAIMRDPAMVYKIGGRSSDLLKMKPEDSSEAVIIAIHEGGGNWSGVAKTVTLDWGGKIFDATFKCPREKCLEILENSYDWIGKEVTFQYNGLTAYKVPNFAQIDPNNCFKR